MVCPWILNVKLNVNKIYNLLWLSLADCQWFISIFNRHSMFYWNSIIPIGSPILAYSLRKHDRARKCYKLKENIFNIWLTQMHKFVGFVLISIRVATKTIKLLALVGYKRCGDEPGRKIALVYRTVSLIGSEMFSHHSSFLYQIKVASGHRHGK